MNCSNCYQEIPLSRHGNSTYCSDECASEVRKATSYLHYHERNDLFNEYRRNEAILRKYHGIFSLGHTLHYHQLLDEGFNFDFSVGGTLGPNEEPCKAIGEFAYYLNIKTKTVSIWKLN